MQSESTPFRTEDLLAQVGWLRGLASELVRDPAAAEDLAQETALAFLRKPPRSDRALRPWLARVARNLAFNKQREATRRIAREESLAHAAQEQGAAPDELVEHLEAQRMLVEELIALDEPLRTALVLRWFRGLDSASIERLQGVPASTVRWRLARGLESLRERLDRRFGGDRGAWRAALVLPLTHTAPTAVSATSSAGATAAQTTAGAWIMQTGTKIGVAAALLIGLGIGLWRLDEYRSEHRPEPQVADLDEFSGGEDARSGEAESSALVSGASPDGRSATAGPEDQAVRAAPLPRAEDCCIVGVVVDGQGRGMAGAQVRALPSSMGDASAFLLGFLGETQARTAETDEQGAFSIAVPQARAFDVVADFPSFAPSAATSCFAGERYEIRLLGGAEIRMVVRTAGGGEGASELPASGAELSLAVLHEAGRAAHWTARAVADARGEALFTHVPVGQILASAKLAGFAECADRVGAADGEQSTCTLVLARGGEIEGMVVERGNGAVLAGVSVGSRGLGTALSDSSGRFRLSDIVLGEGYHTLTARKPGWTPSSELLQLTAERPKRTLRFELEPALRARGIVNDAAGLPLVSVSVSCVGRYGTGPFSGESVTTSTLTQSDGSYELLDLRAGANYRVAFARTGYGAKVLAIGRLDPLRGPIDLGVSVLDAAASIAGVVRGLALPEQWTLVNLLWAGPGAGAADGVEPLLATRTDPRGRFVFDGLGAGRYLLELLEPPSHTVKRSIGPRAWRTVELRPGRSEANIVLELDARAVSGRVLDELGQALSNIDLKLWGSNRDEAPLASARSSRSGDFRLNVETAGPFRLSAEDSTLRFESASVEVVRPGEADLVVRLATRRSPFAIRGRLHDPAGPLVGNVYVVFHDASTNQRIGRVAIPLEDGSFVMTDLEDRAYHLELLDFAGHYETVRVENVHANTDPVELRLARRK